MLKFEGQPPQAVCELLNADSAELMTPIPGVSYETDDLKTYILAMRSNHPGLARHTGAWVGMYRGLYSRGNMVKAMRAEGAFTAGNLMMYELLCRVAAAEDQTLPDPEFPSDNVVDTEVSENRAEWLIDASMRGVKLHSDHPNFFDAALELSDCAMTNTV